MSVWLSDLREIYVPFDDVTSEVLDCTSLFLLFPFAFILTSLITHICFSVTEKECSVRPA